MGDPRTNKKRYKGPSHPWQRKRIESEKIIKTDYGLKNKKEIWKSQSELKRVSAQAKKLVTLRGQEQGKKEEKQLLDRLYKLGLVEEGSHLEDVLTLTLKNILDRRLQSIVAKKGLATTPKQARQFIIHGHVLVNGRKITVPSYLLSRVEETTVEFNPISKLASVEHPERQKEKTRKELKEAKEKEIAEAAKQKESKLEMTEEELAKIEKEIGAVVEA